MEFWGIEVKSGKPYSVELEDERVVHLSQACLGESKDRGNDPIYLYVTINDKKLVLGTLFPNKSPQLQFDLMFEKSFTLSHSWKNGTVNFLGYECDQADDESGSSDYDSDSVSEEDMPTHVCGHDNANGKPTVQAAKLKVNPAKPVKDVKEDSDSSDGSEIESSEDELDSDEDEDSDLDSSEAEETPKKVEKVSKKRPAESASETAGKKAKFVTPKKTEADNKKSHVHVDTPYPSKQAGKASAGKASAGKASANQSKQKTPESAGAHSCEPCKRSFKSEQALESHSKAKHSNAK